MNRRTTDPRRHWQKLVEEKGLVYHTPDGQKYWDESVYYSFTMAEVDLLEAATNELHGMCIEAAGNVIDKKRYAQLGIRPEWAALIERSWNEEPPAIYGRFDLWYDGQSNPKMLEYNADTPTSLLEAAVTQWFWMKDKFGDGGDQWNSIHERLVRKWGELRQWLDGGLVHFAHMDTREDFMTVDYLADTAREAGLRWHLIKMEQIGTDGEDFIDDEMRPMRNIFKLYPWEWLLKDQFAKHVDLGQQNWIEPPWKMLLSNKGILAVLWELYPNHPYLLPTYFGEPRGMTAWARKPLFSREGANITLSVDVNAEQVAIDHTKGLYGTEGYVYQELCQLPDFDGRHPVLGSWVVDGAAAGMGIREDAGLITGNLSTFVPHVIEG